MFKLTYRISAHDNIVLMKMTSEISEMTLVQTVLSQSVELMAGI